MLILILTLYYSILYVYMTILYLLCVIYSVLGCCGQDCDEGDQQEVCRVESVWDEAEPTAFVHATNSTATGTAQTK